MNFFEPISYKKLVKIIGQRHPIDPDTKQRFSTKDRTTVREYNSKISDACFCYAAAQACKKLKRHLNSKIKTEESSKLERPPSMADMPDSSSGSSDSNEGEDAGRDITACSIALGEGSTIYL